MPGSITGLVFRWDVWKDTSLTFRSFSPYSIFCVMYFKAQAFYTHNDLTLLSLAQPKLRQRYIDRQELRGCVGQTKAYEGKWDREWNARESLQRGFNSQQSETEMEKMEEHLTLTNRLNLFSPGWFLKHFLLFCQVSHFIFLFILYILIHVKALGTDGMFSFFFFFIFNFDFVLLCNSIHLAAWH